MNGTDGDAEAAAEKNVNRRLIFLGDTLISKSRDTRQPYDDASRVILNLNFRFTVAGLIVFTK